ncbi:MAG: glycosyltransferase family 4 protein [Synechococcales cyanobacterium M58_A2018_015]|nr:glycosyltransferase family 4 protein [Synechococcales cyanobacterium M58_A2018_015]
MSKLAINLAFVGQKPTGLSTYALNLIPELPLPERTLLVPPSVAPRFQGHGSLCRVPANLTAEQGKLGHLRRLIWTQQQLPRLCSRLRSKLLFSLVPEAPLWVGCPAVVMVHDLIPLRFPRWSSPLTAYFRVYVPQVLQQAQHILCNSTATARDLVEFYGVPAAKITAIPLAHDAQHFRLPEAAPPPPERPYFFYLGRHDPYKNLHRLIRAFAHLLHSSEHSSERECDLWIAGSADPRYTPTLQQQAEQLGVSERVKFLDYVAYDQLPLVLHQAIALVYPSLWEGFGFPVLEAMACGTPVITSNLSSLPEVAGDAALLIDPYCEAELVAAMQQVWHDPATQQQLRSAGLARASQFRWSNTGHATAAVLQRYL